VTVEVLFLPGPEDVSFRAASICIERSKSSITAKGRFSLAVSGGKTPLRLFGLLGTTHRKDVRWDLTDIFWVDERCVPPDHEDSNYKGAYDALLSRIDIPAGNIHRIRGEMPPDEGAREYEKELRKYFGEQGVPAFDLVLLGVGVDGHTASLFPGAPSLSERERLTIPVYSEKLKSQRITLTFPVLNSASNVLFLVTGREKIHILKEILESDENSQRYPAGLIRPVNGSVTWLLDREASSLVTSSRG